MRVGPIGHSASWASSGVFFLLFLWQNVWPFSADLLADLVEVHASQFSARHRQKMHMGFLPMKHMKQHITRDLPYGFSMVFPHRTVSLQDGSQPKKHYDWIIFTGAIPFMGPLISQHEYPISYIHRIMCIYSIYHNILHIHIYIYIPASSK